MSVRDTLTVAGSGFLVGVGYAQHDPIGAGIGIVGVVIFVYFAWRKR